MSCLPSSRCYPGRRATWDVGPEGRRDDTPLLSQGPGSLGFENGELCLSRFPKMFRNLVHRLESFFSGILGQAWRERSFRKFYVLCFYTFDVQDLNVNPMIYAKR